jgi:hypothetical protein
MELFAIALQDVGEHLSGEHAGRYLNVVATARSIPELARLFAGWCSFADASSYDGREVPFFKRAQLAAADLHRAGVARLEGIEKLTAFADNLVPHVLWIDGVLELDSELTAAIEAGRLLDHGSPKRWSCAPAPSTPSSFSPVRAALPLPRSTALSGAADAPVATRRSRGPAAATLPTD